MPIAVCSCILDVPQVFILSPICGLTILQGYAVYVTPEVCGKSAPPSDETAEIVRAAGGQWIEDLRPDAGLNQLLVFSNEAALRSKKVKKIVPDILQACAGRRIFAFELLLLAVLRQQLDLDAEETQPHVLMSAEGEETAVAQDAADARRQKRTRASRRT